MRPIFNLQPVVGFELFFATRYRVFSGVERATKYSYSFPRHLRVIDLVVEGHRFVCTCDSRARARCGNCDALAQLEG